MAGAAAFGGANRARTSRASGRGWRKAKHIAPPLRLRIAFSRWRARRSAALLATQVPHVTRRHVLRTGVGLAAASVAGIAIYLRSGTTYATEIGEQRDVSLEDGTRVRLDTDSEIHVSMNEERRRVQLRRGRAHFDVAEDPTRPFQVIARDQLVTASRGEFDVSRDGVLVSVLLQAEPVQVANEKAAAGISTPRTIMPGQLVVFAEDKLVREEQPEMKRASRLALRPARALRGAAGRGGRADESLHAPTHRHSGSGDCAAARSPAITASGTLRRSPLRYRCCCRSRSGSNAIGLPCALLLRRNSAAI